MSRSKYIVAVLLSSIVLETFAITRSDFFGELEDDTLMLVLNDDDSSNGIPLSVPYPFFEKPRSMLYVNNNGAITFSTRAQHYDDIEFPRNQYQLIAQFWGDVDTRGSGTVWFMENNDPELLTRAANYIRKGFVSQQAFRPSHLFIATWDEVGYFNQKSDLTNTFQCVLATDSIDLYVIFLYADIQWTTGDSNHGVNGTGGTPAEVGFNAGDGLNSYSVPGSRTDDIIKIDERSNVGEPGVWVFHVSGRTVRSGGCTDLAPGSSFDLTLDPSHGSILGGETISVSGPCFDSASRIECEFDSIVVSAIFVDKQEVLCISPQLSRAARVNFKLLINGTSVAPAKKFTSIPIEKAYQVDVTTETDTLTFTAMETVRLNWSPESIFPRNTSIDFQVSITMHRLNQNGEWDLLYTFASNSANDGQESLVIPNNLDSNFDVVPIAFQVSASVNPITGVQSETLYTKLVTSGLSAGRWSSQYYYINPLVLRETGFHLCQSWYEGEPAGTGTGLLEKSAPCPPRESQASSLNSGMMKVDYTSFFGRNLSARQWLNTFHRDASSCYTEKLQSSTVSSSQQCCYDNNGDLLTGAPSGGSVAKTAPAQNRVNHFYDDVRPHLLCCTGYAPSCHKYYEHRPSDDGRRYQQPLPAWIIGDPHLVTLDGHRYTFNGKGEFILLTTQNSLFTLQGRMEQFSNASATVLTAIAAMELYSDKVMVAQSRRDLDVYINGERVDLSVVGQQVFRNVTVIRGNGTGISVAFSSGVLINARAENGFLSAFSIVLPATFRGNTQGLLGNYDGDPSNDFFPQNGISSLPTTTAPDRIHDLFGLTWILTNRDDSLFEYLPYESFDGLRNLEFMPTFGIVNPGSADVSICNGDEFCIYDTVTTGNRQVGVATLAAVADIEDAVEQSYPIVCDPPCSNGACVSNNTCRCSAGYTGSQCNTLDNVGSCDLNPCNRNREEICAIVGGSYVCTANCPGSPLCFVVSTGPCNVNHCNNRGVCRPNSTSSYGFECLCPPEYTGRLCDIQNDVCSNNPCQNRGTCSPNSDGSSFTCNCSSGYSGDLCENGVQLSQLTIIIIASVAGGVLVLIIFVAIIVCIVITVVCKRRTKKSIIINEGNKNGTLNKNGTTESSTQLSNGTVGHFASGRSNLPPPPVMTIPAHNPPRRQYPQSHSRLQGTHEQYQGENPAYTRDSKEHEHKVTPPPPYEEWQDDSHQNTIVIDNLPSDSSSIDEPRLNNPVSISISSSSRSNTTSPSGDKESLEGAESLHKHSISSRSFLTPSPAGVDSHSQSHQGLPLRSTASTPSGPVQQVAKRNATIPRNWYSESQQLQASHSVGHIPARARRHSSSGAYMSTGVSVMSIDGSGNLAMVSEV